MLEPGRSVVFGYRLDPRLEYSNLGERVSVDEALLDDVSDERPAGVFVGYLRSPSATFRYDERILMYSCLLT
jgi:hypothetical protein